MAGRKVAATARPAPGAPPARGSIQHAPTIVNSADAAGAIFAARDAGGKGTMVAARRPDPTPWSRIRSSGAGAWRPRAVIVAHGP